MKTACSKEKMLWAGRHVGTVLYAFITRIKLLRPNKEYKRWIVLITFNNFEKVFLLNRYLLFHEHQNVTTVMCWMKMRRQTSYLTGSASCVTPLS
jgi:hypothetical protein